MSDPILNTPLEEHLRVSVPPGDTDRMWRSFKLRKQAAPERRRLRVRKLTGRVAASGVVLAVAAAALFFVFRAPAPGPLALDGGHVLPETLGSAVESSVFDLDDGSRIVLSAQAEAHVVVNSERELRTTLSRGSATYDVRPGGPRRWVIDAGDARVEVLGTRFTVVRRGAQVEVRVQRGVVRVFHPSRRSPARLTAGDTLTVGEPPPDAETRAAVAPATVAGPRASVPPAEPQLIEPQVARLEPASVANDPGAGWRELAERGEFARAYRSLGERGLRRRGRVAPPEELLLLADLARRSNHAQEALPLYARLVRVAPDDVRAPVAAFSLGRLQLASSPQQAADSFAFVREHPAGAALREDATALEASAAARAGLHDRASRVARLYLSRFPSGRRAESMARLVR